ncbi:MAG: N-acetyltransferase [Candidatus Sulfobium sp.]
MKIRKARISDLREVQRLINEFARREEMIPRSLNELYESIRDFLVSEDGGAITGACALHILWEDLAEIRSLAVREEHQRMGTGRKLVRRCLSEARSLGIDRVFVLTYQPDFFKKLGFTDIEKSSLPQKIWGDCIRCPKFPECDEHALILDLKPEDKVL